MLVPNLNPKESPKHACFKFDLPKSRGIINIRVLVLGWEHWAAGVEDCNS